MIPSVAEIAATIRGPFTVTDAETGATLHTGDPDALPPDAARWPVLTLRADAGTLVISTRAPAPISPAEKARRAREEHLRTLSAPYTPGGRRMY